MVGAQWRISLIPDYQPPAERSVSVIKLDDVLGPKLNLSQNPTRES